MGVGKGEREEPCMMALRTLFISCVRKVGKYNKEFFSFFKKKILSLIINGQSENDGWLDGWMDGWMDGWVWDWIGLIGWMDFSFTPYWMPTLLQIQIGSKLQHHQPKLGPKGAML